MKYLRMFMIMAMLAFVLTGCWGAREMEHMIYANSVGVDYVKGNVVIYVQLASFSDVAKRESSSAPKQQKTSVGKAVGKTFDAAIFNLYSTSQQRLAWSHVKAIVFSEEALKHGLVDQVFDVWDRYYEFRYTVWTMATKDPIEKVFYTTSNLDLSILYSQLNNPAESYSQSSIIAPLYLYKFIWKWEEKGQTVILPYLKIIEEGWTDNSKPSPKLRHDGICVLQNKKLKACLPRNRIIGLRWIENETIRTALQLTDDESTVATVVMENIKPSITPMIKDGKAAFSIKVSMIGNIPELNEPLKLEKMEKLANEEIKKQIIETYLIGLSRKADILGLSDSLYRKMPKEWHRLAVNGELPLNRSSLDSINVNVRLLSGGISKMK